MLVPEGASGQRCWSPAPPIGSILITSAPSWARVRPHSGEATKLDISRTLSPSSGAAWDMATRVAAPGRPARPGQARSAGSGPLSEVRPAQRGQAGLAGRGLGGQPPQVVGAELAGGGQQQREFL